ncbi:hypothetical protein [Kitasatospora sp. NPDC050543]|uniref:hypothetical protein n=1 Tax=Kitasatospora sp. NPDC050543 TaxID=3364054 RepID=UPI0037AB3CD5
MATPPQAGSGYGSFPTQQPPPFAAPGYGPAMAAAPGVPAAPAGRKGGLRRNAGWAFAGAVLASGAWTAAVLGLPGLVSTASSPESVAKYRVVDDLCETAKFVKFSQLYPSKDDSPYHHSTRHSALDSMSCSASQKRTGTGDSDYATLYLDINLHKAVSARPEFEAARSALQQQQYQISDVPNLGEQAFVAFREEPSGSDKTWRSVSQLLEVRDGGMTLYFSWSGSYQQGKTTAPDRETIRQALLADGRDALKAVGG